MLKIFLGNKCSRFTWEPEDRASSSPRGSLISRISRRCRRQSARLAANRSPASFERSGPALRTNLKDFVKPPSVPRASRVGARTSLADFSLGAQLEAGWRRPELCGSSRSATSPFSREPFPPRSRPLLPRAMSPSHYLHLALLPSSSRDLSSSFPSAPPSLPPSLLPLVPLAVRFWREGDRQPCPFERVNKDEAKIRSREGKGGLLTREWEGSRNPTGWNNRLRLCAH